MLGLETALAVTLDLVRENVLTPLEFVRCWSTNPARLLDLEGGSLATGCPGDIVLVNPDCEWTYDAAKGFSKSRNSPWTGQGMTGRVVATIVDGRIVYHQDRGVLIR